MKLQLLLSLAAVTACTDQEEVLATTQSNLIGADNAAIYNVAGNGITNMSKGNWGSDWSHVIPLIADGSSLIFLYSRELGTAKVEKVASNGTMTTINSFDVSTDWDEVVASKTPASSGFNLLFYRRSDSTLKALNVNGDTGGVTVAFQQTIPSPSDIAHPGWDYMRSAKLSAAGELVFYDRLGGEEIVMRNAGGSTHFTTLAHQHGWQTTWDQMATGDMNNDNVDDIVLYSAETGDLKIETLDSSGNDTGSISMPNAEQSAGAQLAVADFGGGGQPDILLYQVEGSPTFENGRLRIWTDDPATGKRTLQVSNVNVQDGWTSVVQVGLGTSKKGIFFYSNQRVVKVRVHAVRLDSSKPSANFDGAADQAKLDTLAKGLRKTYAAAGIAFDLETGPLLTNTLLAQWECGRDGNDFLLPIVDDYLATAVPADELPILVPLQGTAGSAGCSGLGQNFVKSSDDHGHLYTSGFGFDTDKHFAHEVGHFLGLRHIDIPESTEAGTASRIGSTGTIDTLDVDDNSDNIPYLPLYDTPPVLGESWWKNLNSSTYRTLECNAGHVQTLKGIGGHTVDLVVQPLDVMSYNDCAGNLAANPNQGVYRLTREQQQLARHTLYTTRKALIGM